MGVPPVGRGVRLYVICVTRKFYHSLVNIVHTVVGEMHLVEYVEFVQSGNLL